MTPHLGNTILFRSSQQLPRLRLGPSKGFLSWHGALLGPSTRLVHCFRNYRDTRTPSGVARLARRSQGTVNNNWRKPWLCVCWKRTFLHRSLILKSQQNRIELVTRPGLHQAGQILGLGDQDHRIPGGHPHHWPGLCARGNPKAGSGVAQGRRHICWTNHRR